MCTHTSSTHSTTRPTRTERYFQPFLVTCSCNWRSCYFPKGDTLCINTLQSKKDGLAFCGVGVAVLRAGESCVKVVAVSSKGPSVTHQLANETCSGMVHSQIQNWNHWSPLLSQSIQTIQTKPKNVSFPINSNKAQKRFLSRCKETCITENLHNSK